MDARAEQCLQMVSGLTDYLDFAHEHGCHLALIRYSLSPDDVSAGALDQVLNALFWGVSATFVELRRLAPMALMLGASEEEIQAALGPHGWGLPHLINLN